ncbi:MAG: transglycosylase domain-containing protein, partial [Flavobacteriales bacterium]|nr:transglycosylase domain-containing protein [Flavobacteriales bacterium]
MCNTFQKSLRYVKWFFVTVLLLVLISRTIVPDSKFETPTSTVVFDANGYLLGAKIATDGQWRFPQSDSIPNKFKTCIKLYEDQYFDFHPGINPVSILRALQVNIKSGRATQGGSTLTMQVARLLGERSARTIYKKVKELFIAFHLEINYSKDEILTMYTSNAPFGGNVVGLDAAAWRYYGRNANQLSWAEYAVLAVLPNAPSLIYPGKNQEKLRKKRDILLDKLKEKGHIDQQTCELSKLEELPSRPFPLPKYAYHLLDRVSVSHRGQTVTTTVDKFVQQRVQAIINRHVEQLSGNEINNAAAIVIDVKTNAIIAYVGNATNSWEHSNAVDVIKANRSTGSVLKPFLYSSMLSSGELLPEMLIP